MSESITPRRRRRSRYRFRRPRLTVKRGILLGLTTLVAVTGLITARFYLAVGHATGEWNPVSIIGQAVDRGKSSTFHAALAQHDRVNVALYGFGGGNHDGPYLTDSIMVISIQQLPGQQVQIAQLSIPRDWYVPIDLGPGRPSYYQRINTAYSIGQTGSPVSSSLYPTSVTDAGAKQADHVLEQLLGIHIDYYVGVDFQAFKDAVDAVGGVDLNVERTFTDYQYPAGDCSDTDPNCGFMTVHFDAGMQHMDGARALIYARSRHATDPAEATDFARSRRQQLLIAALKDRVASLPDIVSRGPDLLNALAGHYATNLTFNDEVAFLDLVKNADTSKIAHLDLDDQNFLYECGYPTNCGAAYLYTHDNSYASIQKYVAGELVPPPTLAEQAPITVVNASGWYGASARWADLLSRLGFKATDGGDARYSATTKVIDGTGGPGANTAAWLANYFTPGTPPTPAAPAAAATPASSAGITLVLGADEERAFNNQSSTPVSQAAGSGNTGVVASTPVPPPVRTPTPLPRPVHTPTPPPATPTPKPHKP